MEGKKLKELILVQNGRRTHLSYYYIVDLGADKVVRTPVATLLNEGGHGSTVWSGSVLYNVGGETSSDELKSKNIPGDHYTHLGASCLELNIPHLLSLVQDEDEDAVLNSRSNNKWKPAPLMQHNRIDPICASLGGSIYALGGWAPSSPSCIGEVFIPELKKWEPLAPPPSCVPVKSDCVSYPVIPDEKNERLLVHFRNVNSLYAYYPATQQWDCLAENFRRWKKATSLADDVLYFFIRGPRDCIAAYDLLTKEWLNIEYISKFNYDVFLSKFVDMLYLGDGVLCLANFCPFYDDNSLPPSHKTMLQFCKFGVERTSPSEVRVNPISGHRFPFEGYLKATRFILL